MKGRHRGVLAFAIVSLLVLSALPALLPLASGAPTPKPATSLSVSVVPLRLPADGGTYSAVVVGFVDASRNPSIAVNATTVYLTSSQQNVGTVPNSVVIPPGASYVVVDFTTTKQPGVTTVTASAAGFATAGTIVDTRIPSGYASQLKLASVPADVLAGSTGSLVVQLEDDTGAPAVATSAVNVSVTSSSQTTIQPKARNVIVAAGTDVAFVNFTAGYTLASAFITASASSFTSATTTVSVIGASPYALHVSAQPGQIVEKGTGRVEVWLADQVGRPAIAASPVLITVTSSNITIAQFTKTTLLIAAGHSSAVANFTAGSIRGVATITASAQNLQSGFDTISTFKTSLKPAAIKLFIGPNPVIANGATYPAITVGLINATGYPALAQGTTIVNLTSSAVGVGTITTSVTIPSGSQSAVASFSSAYLVGSSVITASAQNLLSAQAQITTFGPVPASLLVSTVSTSVLANGATDDILAIVLQDVAGDPAIAPSAISVHLTSSQPAVVNVQPYITIRAGASYVLTSVQTGIAAGLSNITVSAPNFGASSTLLHVTIPAPTGIHLYLGPATGINRTSGQETMVTVQLQDINGLPAKASQPTSITITSSNTTVLQKPVVLSISPGQDYASTFLSTQTPGRTNLTASAAGLGASSSVLQVLSNPSSVVISPVPQIPYTNESSTITLTAMDLGTGLSGAHVVWSTTSGLLSSLNSTTNSKGMAYVVLTSSLPGVSIVTASVTSPLIGRLNATTTIVFQAIPTPPTKSLVQELGVFLYVIIIIIIAVLGAVAFLFLRRRRRAKAGEPGVEETSTIDELEDQPDLGTTEDTLAFRGNKYFLSGE